MNAWAEAVEGARASGRELLDLTISNPTLCGLGASSREMLAPLGAPDALRYTPDPLGMPRAREAVARYYRDHGVGISPNRVCLTTSTSEAYSFLFRLLCDPGDEVLMARPSYPLFDMLARLDDVALREFPLLYEPGVASGAHQGWSLDFGGLEAAISSRTRALLLVHPNNPTGHYVSDAERQQVVALCAARGLALIVDEVFLDYGLMTGTTRPMPRTFAAEVHCLCFVLSGLSKVCALPQMKISWLVAGGPPVEVDEAMRRLEIVADTFLSVNAPMQFALPVWLDERQQVQREIRLRLQENLVVLDRRLRGSLGERLALEGGWTAVLRVPRHVDDEEFAAAALRRGVLVQPGSFYGLPAGRCVVSLLTEPEVWRHGLALLPL